MKLLLLLSLVSILVVADEDGVDAVLYDTGPVNENSPGMTNKSSI